MLPLRRTQKQLDNPGMESSSEILSLLPIDFLTVSEDAETFGIDAEAKMVQSTS